LLACLPDDRYMYIVQYAPGSNLDSRLGTFGRIFAEETAMSLNGEVLRIIMAASCNEDQKSTFIFKSHKIENSYFFLLLFSFSTIKYWKL
jgi:hypothetical protein